VNVHKTTKEEKYIKQSKFLFCDSTVKLQNQLVRNRKTEIYRSCKHIARR